MQLYSLEYSGVKASYNDDIEVSKKENHNCIASEKMEQRHRPCKEELFSR